ncbi:hypothetical protein OIDMADRAFT_111204 [Oidiodendron maius Zn]|uniref:protein S-acyltransferase n=1 Tax=Oidiodendron maius (strain Zn) TaxID=913774 RepID=A0A0C3HLV4_OIDMZ|nr:hypothetical protein OIDMADRAFT_111204 [Oidiodendron maius Zn]
MSPYREFRVQTLDRDITDGILLDDEGAAIYETGYGALLLTIIKLNDVATLNRYLATHPAAPGPGETDRFDAFWAAAYHGSTDALRILLEHYAAHSTQIIAPDARGFLLLNVACQFAQVDTARFLLDNHLAAGDIHARDDYGMTALLAAAASFFDLAYEENDKRDLMRDTMACSEELMLLLLDRGASARDAVTRADEKPRDTVLTLAISRASSKLVKRLIDEGADVHTKKMHFLNDGSFGGLDTIWDVTPLHIGSFYSNVEGIQTLLDNRGSGIYIADMVSCCDSFGRHPLHWAAGGPSPLEFALSNATTTIKLLLTSNPDTVNTQDKQGDTALHYAARSHAQRISKNSDTLKFLCENGADASLRDRKGQTPLHCLCFHAPGSEPIDTSLIPLLLAHGSDIGDADADGNTPLHLAVKNLQSVEAVQLLLNQGANVGAKNLIGNTPLHQAAGGHIWIQEGELTHNDRMRAQDEMMRVLQEAEGNLNLMDQENAAGKTPRLIREERRNRWLGKGPR